MKNKCFEIRWKEASIDCDGALNLDPKNIKAYWRRALAKQQLNNFKGAQEGHKKWVLKFKNESQVMNELF